MRFLLICFFAFLFLGCSVEDQGSSPSTQGIQKQLAEIDTIAWYVKFEKGSDDSNWDSMIRVDLGGLSSKTFIFSDKTFDGVVHKTWVKCKDLK